MTAREIKTIIFLIRNYETAIDEFKSIKPEGLFVAFLEICRKNQKKIRYI